MDTCFIGMHVDRPLKRDNKYHIALLCSVHQEVYLTGQDGHALLVVLGYEVIWVPGLLPLHIQPQRPNLITNKHATDSIIVQ